MMAVAAGSPMRMPSTTGVDITRNRLEGEAAIHKRLLDREKLKDKVNGVQYFKSYLRPLFVKGASNVLLVPLPAIYDLAPW